MGSKYKQDYASRTRGFTSNQAQVVSGSRTETEDEDEDPEDYRYP